MSGRKNVLAPYQIVTDGDLSDSLTSLPTNIQYLDNICIQLIWTGNAVGNFFVEGSLNYNQDANGNILNVGNWEPITLDPVPVASGVDDTDLIDMNQLSFPWIRVTYESDSGSGTLQAFVGGKML